MNKFILRLYLLIIFLISSVAINATKTYYTEAISVKVKDCGYSDWSYINPGNFITIDYEKSTIYISSGVLMDHLNYLYKVDYSTVQGFIFESINKKTLYNKKSGYYTEEYLVALDPENNLCKIVIMTFKSQKKFIEIKYKDDSYMYSLSNN